MNRTVVIHLAWLLATVAKSVDAILQKSAADSAPLNKNQIRSLALAAIKSSNPIERRQAFDRILEEMATDRRIRSMILSENLFALLDQYRIPSDERMGN